MWIPKLKSYEGFNKDITNKELKKELGTWELPPAFLSE